VVEARGHSDGISVIPNGVDLEEFVVSAGRGAARARFGLENALVIGFSGFIRPWHGLEWAIDALKTLPDHVRLLVLGDGPARASLDGRVRERGVEARVTWAGRIAHDEMATTASAFDIALQPRAVSYASPLKLFEYMALALPVIAPDQPNIR